MHIFDQLKFLFGVEARQPFIAEQYAQVPDEKYVAWHMDTNPCDQYPYVKIVSKMLEMPLVVFGGGVAPIPWRKAAFVAKNASVIVASDLMGTMLASMYDVPTLGLYGNRPENTTSPYIKPKRYVSLWSGKGTYGRDGSAGIRSILPEDVTNAILQLVSSKRRISSKTVFIGDRFCGEKVLFFYPSKANSLKSRIKNCILLVDDRIPNEYISKAADACDSFFLNINGHVSNEFLSKNLKKIAGVEIVCDNTPFSVARHLNVLGKKFSPMCIDPACPNLLDYVDHKVSRLEPLAECDGGMYGSSADFFDGEKTYPSLTFLKEGLEKASPMPIMGHERLPDFFRFKHFFYVSRSGDDRQR